jgi:hypothetical protein
LNDDEIDKKLDKIDRIATYTLRICIAIFILCSLMVATSFASPLPTSGLAIPVENVISLMVKQLKFFMAVVGLAISTIQGLVIYIYRDGQATMRTLFAEQMKTMRADMKTLEAKTAGDTKNIGDLMRNGLGRVALLEADAKLMPDRYVQSAICKERH